MLPNDIFFTILALLWIVVIYIKQENIPNKKANIKKTIN